MVGKECTGATVVMTRPESGHIGEPLNGFETYDTGSSS